MCFQKNFAQRQESGSNSIVKKNNDFPFYTPQEAHLSLFSRCLQFVKPDKYKSKKAETGWHRLEKSKVFLCFCCCFREIS